MKNHSTLLCTLVFLSAVLLFVLPYTGASAAVDLVDFTIEAEDDRVRLEWTTATEFDNAGFYVWRSTNADDDGERIEVFDSEFADTVPFVPARGDSLTGATYEVFDENVDDGVTYYYTLEAVDINGGSEFHTPDPPSVTVGETPDPQPTATNTRTPTATPTVTSSATATATQTPEQASQPTATRTPQPSATATRTPTARPSATNTSVPPTATEDERTSPTRESGAAQQPSPTREPTPSETPTEETDEQTLPSPTPTDERAYPAPLQTEIVTDTAPVESPTPPVDLSMPRAEVQVPTTIVQPPTGFDLLAFFGRILTVVIGMASMSVLGVAVWFVQSS